MSISRVKGAAAVFKLDVPDRDKIAAEQAPDV
jgi:hypothetical protein